MKTNKSNILRIMLVTGIMFLLCAQGFTQTKTFKINTKGSRYSPSKLEVNAGDVVKLVITGTNEGNKTDQGWVHTFAIKELGIEFFVLEGRNEFQFTAPDPGEYKIECSMNCGPSHEGMVGKLIVH